MSAAGRRIVIDAYFALTPAAVDDLDVFRRSLSHYGIDLAWNDLSIGQSASRPTADRALADDVGVPFGSPEALSLLARWRQAPALQLRWRLQNGSAAQSAGTPIPARFMGGRAARSS